MRDAAGDDLSGVPPLGDKRAADAAPKFTAAGSKVPKWLKIGK